MSVKMFLIIELNGRDLKRERRMFENILFLEMSIPILRDVIVYREYSMMDRSVIFGQQITDKSSHPL